MRITRGSGTARSAGTALVLAAALLLLAGGYPPPPDDDPGTTPPAPIVPAPVAPAEAPFPLDEPPPPLGAPAPEAGTVSLYIDGAPVDVQLLASPVTLRSPVDGIGCGLDPDELDALAERALLTTGPDGRTYLLVSPLPLDQDTIVVSADAPSVRVCGGTFAPASTAALRLDEAILLDARRVDAAGIVSAVVDVGTGTPPGRTTLGVAAYLADGRTTHFYAPVFVLASAEPTTETPEPPVTEEPAPDEGVSGWLADRWWIPALLALLVLLLIWRSRRTGGGGE